MQKCANFKTQNQEPRFRPCSGLFHVPLIITIEVQPSFYPCMYTYVSIKFITIFLNKEKRKEADK